MSAASPPAISVIVPTYNRAHVLTRSIDSVLAQELADVEVVVVDDGSTDDTARVLGAIDDDRVRVIQQVNSGVGAARNAGVLASSSNFVTFLDSDDEASPGWLEAFVERHRKGCDLVFCGANFLGPGDAYKLLLPAEQGREMGGIRGLYLAGTYAMDKQLFDTIGGFRRGLRFSENTDLGLRLGGHHLQRPLAIGTVDRPMITIHHDERPYDAALRYDSAMVLLRHDEEHLRRSPQALSTYLAVAAVAAGRLGRPAEERRLLRRAITSYPRSVRNYARFLRTLLPMRKAGRS